MKRAVPGVLLLALAACGLFPSLDYLDREAGPGGGDGGTPFSTDAPSMVDAQAADGGGAADSAPPDAPVTSDAAPLHCFGGSICAEGQICCMRLDYSSGYCTGASGCLNYTFVCDNGSYCAARGLGSACCATSDDAGLTGSACATTCSGSTMTMCDPLQPGACSQSCGHAKEPANYYVCQ